MRFVWHKSRCYWHVVFFENKEIIEQAFNLNNSLKQRVFSLPILIIRYLIDNMNIYIVGSVKLRVQVITSHKCFVHRQKECQLYLPVHRNKVSAHKHQCTRPLKTIFQYTKNRFSSRPLHIVTHILVLYIIHSNIICILFRNNAYSILWYSYVSYWYLYIQCA